MHKFLILRKVWWLVALLLLVTNLTFFDKVDWLLVALGLVGLASWWAVYLFRAWLALVLVAIRLTFIHDMPVALGYCLISVAVLGLIVLWHDYILSYRQTLQERQPRQLELLAECQRPKLDVPTALILTASDGFGHLVAAKTWSTRLQGMNVVCVDVFTLMPRGLKLVWQSWEYLAVYVPEAHALIHSLALRSPRWLSRSVVHYLSKRLPVTENVVQVITTHPLAAMAASSLLGQTSHTVRGTLVCTDFFINPQALDFNFHEVRLPRDLTEGHSEATQEERDILWRELELNTHTPTTLVMTGGSGLVPAEKMYKLLCWLKKCGCAGRQFVLVCGTNETRYQEAQRQLAHIPNVRVVRFVADISRFYTHFDMVVCKAGGLTTAELLNADSPRIAVWYAFRGQEQANLRWFLRNRRGATYVPFFFETALARWQHA